MNCIKTILKIFIYIHIYTSSQVVDPLDMQFESPINQSVANGMHSYNNSDY